jgi:hypothetical protein
VEQNLSDERMLASGEHVSAGAPLLVLGERAFIGTHLGLAALVDLADGRLACALRIRRHAPGVEGWAGQAPLPVPDVRKPDAFEPDVFENGAQGVYFAPADGDYLYALRAAPDLEGEGLFLFAPIEKGDARALASIEPSSIVAQVQRGPRPALALLDREGNRCDAIHLGLNETFTGAAAALGERLAACTNRALYLFDRTREVYLIDAASLWPGEEEVLGMPREGLGGSVYATQGVWIVLGPRGVWVFGPDS